MVKISTLVQKICSRRFSGPTGRFCVIIKRLNRFYRLKRGCPLNQNKNESAETVEKELAKPPFTQLSFRRTRPLKIIFLEENYISTIYSKLRDVVFT